MPFWASWVISFFVKAVTQYLADKRAEQNLRDLGAATQAAAAKQASETEEAKAKAAADKSLAEVIDEIDPNDPFLRKD